ncbi:MAG: hypothetical protein MUF69_14745 [Desulfobacterota bacterium]|nr:hypothetical protein [Thermodesulfobacteriota bacterium]
MPCFSPCSGARDISPVRTRAGIGYGTVGIERFHFLQITGYVFSRQQIDFIEKQQVGALDLVIEQGAEELPPLPEIAVQNRYHLGHLDARFDDRPVQKKHDLQGIGHAGGLDEQVQGLVFQQDLFHRLDHIAGHGAADTAVGEFVHGGLKPLQEFPVDAHPAEFVDEDRSPGKVPRPLQNAPKQSGLPCAQESGNEDDIA